MTDKEILLEAEIEFEKYKDICTNIKNTWINAYILAHKNGQIESLKYAININNETIKDRKNLQDQ